MHVKFLKQLEPSHDKTMFLFGAANKEAGPTVQSLICFFAGC